MKGSEDVVRLSLFQLGVFLRTKPPVKPIVEFHPSSPRSDHSASWVEHAKEEFEKKNQFFKFIVICFIENLLIKNIMKINLKNTLGTYNSLNPILYSELKKHL